MIDPKLNTLVPEDLANSVEEGKKKREQGTANSGTGLSINDTIGGSASLSSGARGVDTSGVSAGAGVGAGMTHTTTTTAGDSTVPQIVPGARGSGTTVRGGSNTAAPASAMPSSGGTGSDAQSEDLEHSYSPTRDEIESHAYHCWHERGCPDGSPELDWAKAEQELRARRKTRTAGA